MCACENGTGLVREDLERMTCPGGSRVGYAIVTRHPACGYPPGLWQNNQCVDYGHITEEEKKIPPIAAPHVFNLFLKSNSARKC